MTEDNNSKDPQPIDPNLERLEEKFIQLEQKIDDIVYDPANGLMARLRRLEIGKANHVVENRNSIKALRDDLDSIKGSVGTNHALLSDSKKVLKEHKVISTRNQGVLMGMVVLEFLLLLLSLLV